MNQYFITMGTLGVLMFALTGCQGDERLSEVSTVQTEAQLQKEKQFREDRARELEADLAQRQSFFQGVAGTYEGEVETPDGTYSIRIRLVPTVPPYKPDSRVRTPEEVTSDLSALHFRAQIVQWKPGSPIGVIGCRVDNIRPDLNDGTIAIASTDCPSFYEIRVSDGHQSTRSSEEQRRMGRMMADQLRSNRDIQVPVLVGEAYPTSSAVAFPFTAKRRGQ